MTRNNNRYELDDDTFNFDWAYARGNFDWAYARGDQGGRPSGPPNGGNGDTGTSTGTYTSGAPDGASDGFNLELNFLGDAWTLDAMNAFAAAADYLSNLITAGLADDGAIDDLVIDVSLIDIDTIGGTIGQGRPTAVRSSDDATPDGLPVSGEIFVDTNDVDFLLSQGTLDDLALHEILHVMGMGTLWEVPGVRDYLSDPVFVPDLTTRNPNDGDTIITYTGGALDESGTTPLVETEGSLGHWQEEAYGDELMTTVFNTSGNFLSQMSLDALKDLGYSVDDTVGAELATAIDLTASYSLDDFAIV
ncbi:hypothetical protein PEL8287_01965 [Roseovarius litorisediminis]|uniref:Leishmanolysin n=1 Tax=Roseovarius litorisediminis TaxID=1312363 RepID=A0A1Y5SHQ2_9RHOB|nr:hypothetical protein [Roseovarius litorisediminis]SLN39910.1 hypothetical protein PEL8287_01965 [Roseovarius litorisediminis]